jgi:hypothetical protein
MTDTDDHGMTILQLGKGKGKAVPLQAWSGPGLYHQEIHLVLISVRA